MSSLTSSEHLEIILGRNAGIVLLETGIYLGNNMWDGWKQDVMFIVPEYIYLETLLKKHNVCLRSIF